MKKTNRQLVMPKIVIDILIHMYGDFVEKSGRGQKRLTKIIEKMISEQKKTLTVEEALFILRSRKINSFSRDIRNIDIKIDLDSNPIEYYKELYEYHLQNSAYSKRTTIQDCEKFIVFHFIISNI